MTASLSRTTTALALFTLLSACGSPEPTAETPETSAEPLHVRRSIATYEPDCPELAALRRGVAAMQAREATDPTSWCYQANMHAYSTDALGGCPAVDTSQAPASVTCSDGTVIDTQDGMMPGWNQCQHGSYFFVVWHRMYVYHFERILRAAAEDPALTLPYWPWNDGEHRQIPLPLREPADSTTNSLYVEARSTPANAGFKLPTSAVDTTDAFASAIFADQAGDDAFAGHQGLHEQHDALGKSKGLLAIPHAHVHNLTGGSDGWMSDNNTTAQDPLFWVHHSNIDRLWSQWTADHQGTMEGNPVHDPNWMNHQFLFFDETGSPVCMSGKEVVDTAAQLGYVYDNQGEETDTALTADSGTASGDEPDAETTTVATSDTTQVDLSSGATTVQVPLGEGGAEKVQQALAEGGDVLISINGLQFQDNPGMVCEVYVNPATSEGLSTTDTAFAGTLDFFVTRDPKTPYDQPVSPFNGSITLDRSAAEGLGANPQIVLVMRGWEAPDGVDGDEAEDDGVLAWFKSVSVAVR